MMTTLATPPGLIDATRCPLCGEPNRCAMEIDTVPWVAIRGRKGGSTLVVAALHALLGLAEAHQRDAA